MRDFRDVRKELFGVRFGNNKSRYIIGARNRFGRGLRKTILSFGGDVFGLRDFLVDNVRGYGYKEASHFLRNIGYGSDIDILDRHILKNMRKYGAVKDVPASLSRSKYLEIEEKLRRFADRIKIPLYEMDLLFWSEETGEIFK